MRIMIALLPLLGTAWGGCKGETSPRFDEEIRDALSAQLVAPGGGCPGAIAESESNLAFFPTVRFVIGQCVGEHGNRSVGVVAVDRDGLVFLLGNEEGYDFLIRRHAPVGVDSITVVAFGAYASVLAGFVDVAAAPSLFTGQGLGEGSGSDKLSHLLDDRPGLWVVSLHIQMDSDTGRLVVGVEKESAQLIPLSAPLRLR